MTARIWTKEEIRANLQIDDNWVVRAVEAIFKFQTAHEQAAENTTEDNGVGFNAADANILSSFAKQIKRWRDQSRPRFPKPLSERQMNLARKRILKYSGQLTKIANGEVQ